MPWPDYVGQKQHCSSYLTMYHYKAKDQSMRIPPEGLVIRHSEGGIRNANVLSLIMTLYVPSRMAKNIMTTVKSRQ